MSAVVDVAAIVALFAVCVAPAVKVWHDRRRWDASPNARRFR